MKKSTWISLGILALLIIVGLFYQEGSSGDQLKWKNYKKSINKIILNKAGDSVLLSKENRDWLVSSNNYRADKTKVEAVLSLLTNSRTFELISSYTNGYIKYGLDSENHIEIRAFNEDKEVRKLIIGNDSSSANHTYVILDEKGYVYQASGKLRESVDKKEGDFRDQQILSFSTPEFVSVQIVDARMGNRVIAKTNFSAETTGTNDSPPPIEYWADERGNKIKENEMNDIINVFSSLHADTFCDTFYDDYSADVFLRKFLIKTISAEYEFVIVRDWESSDSDQKECILKGRKTGFTIAKETADRLLISYQKLIE